MGYIDDESVIVTLVGYVDTHVDLDYDGGFAGYCAIDCPGESLKQGYVLGSIRGTGAALIVADVNRFYAYVPEDSIDPPWSKFTSPGAELILDEHSKIVVRSIPDMKVAVFEDGE
jgi:hypothetical protein